MSMRSPQRVCLGIKYDFVEIQSVGRSEEEIKVFEGLGQGEASKLLALLFRYQIVEHGVAVIYAAIIHIVVEDLYSHLPVLRLVREVMQIVGRFHDLGTQMVALVNNLRRLVIENLWFDSV